MKASSKITASLIALAMAGTASAETVIHIIGSNADRATTHTAIANILVGESYVGTNADPTKANFAIFRGGTLGAGGPAVTIKTAFVGAAASVGAVAGSLNARFLPDSATGTSNLDPTVGNNPNESAVPDFGMSSNFASTTPYNGVYQGHTYEDLSPNDTLLAVLGFKWVASKGFPAGVSLTPQQVQILFQNGAAPLALFTGNPADQNKTVFATGRNLDAGARLLTFSEAGLGAAAVVKQYKPTSISGASAGVGGFQTGGTVTGHALWPVEPYNGGNSSSLFLGNSGASTGSALAPYVTATLSPAAYQVGNPNATAGYYITYLSSSDADTIAIPNGAVELKWNGVAYSDQAIQEGQYTFWGYQHILHRASLSGVPLQVHDALRDRILNFDANVSGIFLNTMHVSREAEGGLVAPKYF